MNLEKIVRNHLDSIHSHWAKFCNSFGVEQQLSTKEFDSKSFRFVVTEAYADPLGKPIVEGLIAMTVFIDSKGFSLPLPADDAAAAQLYQVLYLDNLEELDKKHPDWLIFKD